MEALRASVEAIGKKKGSSRKSKPASKRRKAS
jgi:hypothetical protein